MEPVTAPVPPPPAEPLKEVSPHSTQEIPHSVSPGTTVLITEIANLKSKCEAAIRESNHNAQLFAEAQNRARIAEKRVQEAEMALHDLAGKNAVENMSAARKIAELENGISELNRALAGLVSDFKLEIDQAEKLTAMLKDKIARFGG